MTGERMEQVVLPLTEHHELLSAAGPFGQSGPDVGLKRGDSRAGLAADRMIDRRGGRFRGRVSVGADAQTGGTARPGQHRGPGGGGGYMERGDQQQQVGLCGHLLPQRDPGGFDGIIGVAALSSGVEVANLQAREQHASPDDIPGGARGGAHQGATGADQVVEQARLPGVDRSDQGNGRALNPIRPARQDSAAAFAWAATE